MQAIKTQACWLVNYISLFGFSCSIGLFGLPIEVKVFLLRDTVHFVLNFIDEYNKFRISSKFLFDEIALNVYLSRFYNFVFDIWKLNCLTFLPNRYCTVCISYEYTKLKISFKFLFDPIPSIDSLILCLIDILKMNWLKSKSFRMVNRPNK